MLKFGRMLVGGMFRLCGLLPGFLNSVL